MNKYSESTLIELPAIEIFQSLGYTHKNCFYDTFGEDGMRGRETPSDVALVPRLRKALLSLNPNLTNEALELAVEELTRDRSSLNPLVANREIYKIIREGVKISVRQKDGSEETETVRVIDFNNPENTDYKSTIPKIFWYNAFIILSNGSESKIGTMTADYEHFNDWKKINSEGEEGIVSLDTIIKGTCEKKRLLDLLENFILFHDTGGSLIKIIAKNHQYLGVNSAIESFKKIKENQGRLGVFWHTQGRRNSS